MNIGGYISIIMMIGGNLSLMIKGIITSIMVIMTTPPS